MLMPKRVLSQGAVIQDVLVWEEENLYSRDFGYPASVPLMIGDVIKIEASKWVKATFDDVYTANDSKICVCCSKVPVNGEPIVIARHAICKFQGLNLPVQGGTEKTFIDAYNAFERRGIMLREVATTPTA
ncbi:hypothetical protein JK628_02980 [Shewanella sp. KX20019]|uniref:hypothetical protein n=1 Tax=Shewanella sp. KX20019 TaxID=2803864 RepID=UPI0019254597|nr:hypothetical protein [Shewanella sp. KX20019]QQX80854.1 hypothetical protein JK628_02980 [Shewanella sp. KX20019]